MDYPIAERARPDERAMFIRRTYGHLAGAILAFVALETLMIKVFPDVGESVARALLSGSWLIVLLAFMGVSWLANYWASSGASAGLQYLGLALFVVAQSIIFVPLLFIAYIKDPTTIPTAGVLTLCVFGGLTAAVFITRKDFSFLGPILCIAGFLALGVILVATFFSPSLLGLVFCFAMVALASGYIIYDTSNILHRYRTDQHVAASLALFASVALLFWYILQILMLSSRRN
jgi:FtsH-binding integral membrane protein